MSLIVPVSKMSFCTVKAAQQTRRFLSLSLSCFYSFLVRRCLVLMFISCSLSSFPSFVLWLIFRHLRSLFFFFFFREMIYVVIVFYDLIFAKATQNTLLSLFSCSSKTQHISLIVSFALAVLVSCYFIVYVCCLVSFMFDVRDACLTQNEIRTRTRAIRGGKNKNNNKNKFAETPT